MALIPVVPDKDRRVLHIGEKGNDVHAAGRLVARALTHNTYYKPTNAQNGVFGQGLLKDVLRLQAAYQLPRTGKVDLATWHAIDPQMHAYERLLLELPKPAPATNGVKLAHQFEVALILGLDFYSQFRPGARAYPLPWKRAADCSDSYLLFRALVLGLLYDGYGNTTTIWSGYQAVSTPAVGDAALYGPGYKTTHVQCVVDVSDKSNPDSIGFGSAPGNRYRVHQRTDFMGYRRTV